MSIIRNAFRRSALRPRIGLNEVLQWVESRLPGQRYQRPHLGVIYPSI